MSAERGAPKRRCVSTACIACRRRKSKVSRPAVLRSLDMGWWIDHLLSVMAICPAVQHVPQCIIHHVCNPYYQIIYRKKIDRSIGVYDPNSDHRRKGVYKKDADTSSSRVLRGGSWNDDPQDARAAFRYGINGYFWLDLRGFRVARGGGLVR